MCCDLFIFRAGSSQKYWCRLRWESSSTMGDQDDLMSFLMSTSSGMPAAPLSGYQAPKSAQQALVQQATPQRKEESKWLEMRRASSTSLGATPKRDRGFEHMGSFASLGLETPPSTAKANPARKDSMTAEIDAVAAKLDGQLAISGKKSERASSSQRTNKKETSPTNGSPDAKSTSPKSSKKGSPDTKNTSPKGSEQDKPDTKNTSPKGSKKDKPDTKNTTPKGKKDSLDTKNTSPKGSNLEEDLSTAQEIGEEELEIAEDPEVDSAGQDDGEECEEEGLIFEVRPVKRPAGKSGPKKDSLVLLMC